MANGQRPKAWPVDRDPLLFEMSVPGIFATGDSRRGFGKGIAAAVGEGSATIGVVHDDLRTV